MRAWKVLACLTAALLFLPWCRVTAEEPQSQTPTYATLLMEADTGQILGGENEHVQVPMGTMAKLMTVLLTAQAVELGTLSPDTLLTASSNANAQRGAVIWLMPGEKMTVEDLLRGVLIGNANDAAVALAEALAKDEAAFVMDMNACAFTLGMRDTVFTNCTGVADERQVTTAADLGLLCRALLDHPFLYPIMTTWHGFLRGEATELVNENDLTRGYDGLLGIKAGHGTDTGYTLAAAARRGDSTYIAIVLGCEDEHARFQTGKELLARGFSGFTLTTPLFSSEFLKPVSVRHGVDTAVEVEAALLQGMVVPKSGAELTTVLVLPEYVEAPVRAGQRIGTVAFYSGDVLLQETALVTVAEVKPMTISRAFLRLLDNMLK